MFKDTVVFDTDVLKRGVAVSITEHISSSMKEHACYPLKGEDNKAGTYTRNYLITSSTLDTLTLIGVIAHSKKLDIKDVTGDDPKFTIKILS